MATSPFQSLTPYEAPQQKVSAGMSGAGDNYNFFTPADTKLPTGAALTPYLTPAGATPDQVTNRTIKYDGGLTREQIGNVGESLSGQLGTVNNNLTTGFTGLNANLGTVNTGVTNVGNAVVEGNKANTAGFAGLNTALATQGTNVDKIGSNLTNYFTQLNAGQDAARAQLGTLNTGFNNFVTDYDQDTTRADQSRTQIQNGMQGGFQQIGEQIGKASTATQQGLQGLTQPQKQGAQSLMSNVAGNGFASRPSPGTTTQGAQESQPNPQIIQGVNTIKSVLASQGGNLDPSLASSFTQIATAFDQNGQLIPSSQGMGGITVSRQMDPQGNLVAAQTDGSGNVLSQTTVNMNASLMAANNLGQATRSPFSYS